MSERLRFTVRMSWTVSAGISPGCAAKRCGLRPTRPGLR